MPAPTIQLRRQLIQRSGQTFPVHEVAFVKDGETVARLAAGDPLLHALELPLEQAERLRTTLAAAIETRPQLSTAFDAILEYLRERQPRR